jgi:hypothetical protein
MLISLISLCDDKQTFPKAEVRKFLLAYEDLYQFEKKSKILPWFTRTTKKAADYLMTKEIEYLKRKFEVLRSRSVVLRSMSEIKSEVASLNNSLPSLT